MNRERFKRKIRVIKPELSEIVEDCLCRFMKSGYLEEREELQESDQLSFLLKQAIGVRIFAHLHKIKPLGGFVCEKTHMENILKILREEEAK